MRYNLAAQNRFLAALHERREIRCFYITGIFTSPLFLYNTSIFHFGDKCPNLFFGQYICEYFLEGSPVDKTIFTETIRYLLKMVHIQSFQFFSRFIPVLFRQAVSSIFVYYKTFFR